MADDAPLDDPALEEEEEEGDYADDVAGDLDDEVDEEGSDDANAADVTGGQILDDESGHHHHTVGKGNRVGEEGMDQHTVVQCATTAGPITMHLHRSWSPHGYDRASSLFERGYYDHSHFFRVVPHFLVQFGISYTNDGELKKFANSAVQDDPKRDELMPFREGYISFAGSGPNSRTSQLFIAYDKSGNLGNSPWETPFGEVVEGMENVRNLYSEYGDQPPWGKGPEQGPIRNQGSKYIENDFPLLDKFKTCTVRRVDADHLREITVKSEEEGLEEQKGGLKGIKSIEEGNRPLMRGRKVKMNAPKHVKYKLPMGDEGTDKISSSLVWKLALVVMSLVLVQQLFSRRKKSKRAGKNV